MALPTRPRWPATKIREEAFIDPTPLHRPTACRPVRRAGQFPHPFATISDKPQRMVLEPHERRAIGADVTGWALSRAAQPCAARRVGFMRRAACAVLVTLFSGCAARPGRPVAIAINPWPGYETLYLASERGIFEKHGLRVEIKEYSSLGDARRGFERGQIDGMACTLVEVLQAREQSAREPRVIMVADYSRGADVILAKPEIRGVGQLRGKRVGLELASLGSYMMSRAARLEGVNIKDVQLVPTDQSEMVDSARSGSLDAAVTYPPVSIQLQKLGWRPIFDSNRIPGEVLDVIAVDKTVLEAYPGFHRAFLASIEEALGYLAAHGTDAVELMAAREHVSPAEFKGALQLLELIEVRRMPEYLAPGGVVERVLPILEADLRQAGQLSGNRGSGGLVARLPESEGRR